MCNNKINPDEVECDDCGMVVGICSQEAWEELFLDATILCCHCDGTNADIVHSAPDGDAVCVERDDMPFGV